MNNAHYFLIKSKNVLYVSGPRAGDLQVNMHIQQTIHIASEWTNFKPNTQSNGSYLTCSFLPHPPPHHWVTSSPSLSSSHIQLTTFNFLIPYIDLIKNSDQFWLVVPILLQHRPTFSLLPLLCLLSGVPLPSVPQAHFYHICSISCTVYPNPNQCPIFLTRHNIF